MYPRWKRKRKRKRKRKSTNYETWVGLLLNFQLDSSGLEGSLSEQSNIPTDSTCTPDENENENENENQPTTKPGLDCFWTPNWTVQDWKVHFQSKVIYQQTQHVPQMKTKTKTKTKTKINQLRNLGWIASKLPTGQFRIGRFISVRTDHGRGKISKRPKCKNSQP